MKVTAPGTAAGPPEAASSYTAEFTAAQIFSFSDLVRRLGQAYGPDTERHLRQDLADALNGFAMLLPEPSDADGDVYLASVRAGDLPNWGMDDQPLTETTEEWAARVRAAQPPSSDAVTARSFPGCPESAGAARAWVAGFVPGSPAADDVTLMTSELVTNAVLYSASGLPGGTVTVSVRTGGGSVRVDVIDQGQAPPCSAARHGMGMGLGIVRELADSFGADGADRWFTLSTAGRSASILAAYRAAGADEAEFTACRELAGAAAVCGIPGGAL